VFAMRSVVARASRVVALPPGDIGVLLRVFEDVLAEVDVDLWPMVVPRGRFLCVEDRLDGLVLEPGVLGVGHEYLEPVGQQPHAMAGDMGHCNRRSVVPGAEKFMVVLPTQGLDLGQLPRTIAMVVGKLDSGL